eukprot:CAMPEP_0169230938 /NCGR_PEP_ID=MMETSP1016-20121227/26218_1 /TAXON_ID=342587 /ORGANISM="Karlodinium micrum, Strain CCMP2283" /LENGTH=98 /DNA_ID=CAMNT_0009309985 /DNA_START=123 /DNA_END=419 /DNA_ORIENTATION=+
MNGATMAQAMTARPNLVPNVLIVSMKSACIISINSLAATGSAPLIHSPARTNGIRKMNKNGVAMFSPISAAGKDKPDNAHKAVSDTVGNIGIYNGTVP